MRDLSKRYLEEISPRKQSGWRDAEKFDYINAKLGSLKVAAVDVNDCDRLHQSMKNKPGPVQANRTLTILRSAFDFAIRLNWRPEKDNPAKLVKRFTEKPRKRYLTGEEYPRLFAVLHESRNQVVADLIRFLLTTGCRKSEAFNMKWDDVDLKAEEWTKPTTKTGDSHTVPLNAPAMEIIANQPRKSEYVFTTATGRRFTDIKKQWSAIKKDADLHNLTLHDLRHCSASLLVNDGETLPIIGELLGHSDISSTARYANVDKRAARAASDRLGRKLVEYDKKVVS
jgi:integrase